MDPVQAKELYEKYFYYILAGSVIFGAVIGAVPLLIGIRRGRRNLGLIAFVVTLVDSGISPLLGVVTAIIFTVVVLVKSNTKTSGDNSSTDSSA